MQNFSKRLRKAILTSGLKQREICDMAGIKQPYLSQIINDKSSLQNIDLKRKLAQITGVDERWLIDGDELYEPPLQNPDDNAKHDDNNAKSALDIMTQAYATLMPNLPSEDLMWLVDKVQQQPSKFAPIIPCLLEELKKRMDKKNQE